MLKKILGTAGLVVLCLALGACASQGKRIAQVFDSLPTPQKTELLYKQGGTRQGSQDACFFTYKQYLYGTDQDSEQVAEFYVQAMSTARWHPNTGPLVPPGRLAWERNNQEYRLSISFDPHLDFPKDVVAAAEERFATVYFISITYADRLARTQCLD